jgi:hypothetical protein
MDRDIPPVDEALPAVRELMESSGTEFRVVGGVAVIHHGYLRTTEDIDVLVEEGFAARMGSWLAAHDFVRETGHRLRHRPSGVVVHLLIAGEPMPRPDAPPYPSPASLEPSARDAAIVGLQGLMRLKLLAGRHQNRADVVALLKGLDERGYLELEASMEPELRASLWSLRRDALEEASWQ